MQATARMASVVSAASYARRRLIRVVRPTPEHDYESLLHVLVHAGGSDLAHVRPQACLCGVHSPPSHGMASETHQVCVCFSCLLRRIPPRRFRQHSQLHSIFCSLPSGRPPLRHLHYTTDAHQAGGSDQWQTDSPWRYTNHMNRVLMTGAHQTKGHPRANKTDAGNGSYGICRVINASRSPSPDPTRSPNRIAP